MDGSILSEKYLEKGWDVIGIDRWNPTGLRPNLINCTGNEKFTLETGDITDKHFMEQMIKKYQPDHMYNMAAISLVPESFKIPTVVFETNTLAVLNMLESIRYHSPHTRFYQASTSEQIGENTQKLQNTESKMLPTSPYAIAKLASYHLVRLYRKAYGIFGVNGMLWNHEGPRRGRDFVTRKISLAIARIKHGKQDIVSLGNLDSFRDWGLANDYCEAMMMMLEADEPDDYAVATGETHSVREFVEHAFDAAGYKITWEGEGLNEVGKDQDGIVRVTINERYYRPSDVLYLHGDPSKIKEKLGWEPKTKFKELVTMMVESDAEGEK